MRTNRDAILNPSEVLRKTWLLIIANDMYASAKTDFESLDEVVRYLDQDVELYPVSDELCLTYAPESNIETLYYRNGLAVVSAITVGG